MIVGQNYKIVAELGAGGMGVVYQAVDLTLEREVALKKLRTEFSRSPEVAERFLKEAKIQARMNHPGIAQLYTLFREDDSFYMVMELESGTPLSRLMPMPWQRAVYVLGQTLDSLEYAHSLGVLHRDIKPDNLLVNAKGAVKIMDFGIAHVLGHSRQTREKSIIGTPEYMAPERITAKDVDRRSDVYSLGILLFEMVSGRLPFQADTEFEILKHQIETPMPALSGAVAGIPAFLDAAIAKACAKDPGARFESCAAMAEALRSGAGSGAGEMTRSGWAALSTLSEVEQWRHRIESLLATGEIEVAEHALENALADFPDNAALKGCANLIAKARTLQTSEAPARIAERNLYVRETLDRLREHERNGAWQEGCQLAREALDRYPRVWALSLALTEFERKSSRMG